MRSSLFVRLHHIRRVPAALLREQQGAQGTAGVISLLEEKHYDLEFDEYCFCRIRCAQRVIAAFVYHSRVVEKPKGYRPTAIHFEKWVNALYWYRDSFIFTSSWQMMNRSVHLRITISVKALSVVFSGVRFIRF